MTFEEKVKSLSPKQIVEAMIVGLEKEYYKVDMNTFGNSSFQGTCFGCAATHAITQISGVCFTERTIDFSDGRANYLDCDEDFLLELEEAYDYLRKGQVYLYNLNAERIKIAELPIPTIDLPELYTQNWKENLIHYKEYLKTLN